MTNEEKAKELGKKYQTPCHGVGDCEFEAKQAALEMAKWKDSQPQIIEIFGKRVKIVEDDGHTIGFCNDCAFDYFCHYKLGRGYLCETSNHNLNRHFVEVDEDGNEIGGEK